jgi:hypothetical protein
MQSRYLTHRNIFSGKFWLNAIVNSSAIRLATAIFNYFNSAILTSRHIFSIEIRLPLYQIAAQLAASVDRPLQYIMDSDDLPLYQQRPVKFWIRISWRIINRIRNYFRIWVRGPDGFDWWGKRSRKSWATGSLCHLNNKNSQLGQLLVIILVRWEYYY